MVSDLKRALARSWSRHRGSCNGNINNDASSPKRDSVAFGAAAVLSIVLAVGARRRSAQQAYQESPVGYLLRLGQELQPHALIVD
jgi:hypothetical protein